MHTAADEMEKSDFLRKEKGAGIIQDKTAGRGNKPEAFCSPREYFYQAGAKLMIHGVH